MNLGLKALTLKAFYDEDFAVREFGPVLAWALSEKLAVSGLNASKTGKNMYWRALDESHLKF